MPFPSSILVPLIHWQIRRMNRGFPTQHSPFRRTRTAPNVQRREAFEDLWQSTLARGVPNALIDYHLPYPKIDFLHYLCDDLGYVAHGSPRADLEVLQPIRLTGDTTEFGKREQIFASPDAVWAAWFAILDKRRMRMTNNGCIRIGAYGSNWTKIYYFMLPKEGKEPANRPLTDGMIYIARAEDFPHHRPSPAPAWMGIDVEEWGSTQPVTPLARLPFAVADFPYLDRVEFVLG